MGTSRVVARFPLFLAGDLSLGEPVRPLNATDSFFSGADFS
jgi:hypothetical protein